jgi:signal transduction histidine kinase
MVSCRYYGQKVLVVLNNLNLALCGYFVNGDLTAHIKSMRLMLHDLAQPLSVMAGAVDLLMIDSDPRSRQFDDIKYISEQLQLILDKMQEIRQLARQMPIPEEGSGA